jgi:hypothetical protein
MAEGHVQNFGQRAGQQRLAGAGRADEQDVALFDLHLVMPGVAQFSSDDAGADPASGA